MDTSSMEPARPSGLPQHNELADAVERLARERTRAPARWRAASRPPSSTTTTRTLSTRRRWPGGPPARPRCSPFSSAARGCSGSPRRPSSLPRSARSRSTSRSSSRSRSARSHSASLSTWATSTPARTSRPNSAARGASPSDSTRPRTRGVCGSSSRRSGRGCRTAGREGHRAARLPRQGRGA